MITKNSTIKFKKDITFKNIPFSIPDNLKKAFLNSTFKVTAITPEMISFENSVIGIGLMSPDELYKYFEESASNSSNDISSMLIPDSIPYSPKWTSWTEYTYNGEKILYRYKDTAYGSVKLECNFTPDEDEPFIGRATCHGDDEFDLNTGIRICKYRSDIKDYKSAIYYLEDYVQTCQKQINHCKDEINKRNKELNNFLEDLY